MYILMVLHNALDNRVVSRNQLLCLILMMILMLMICENGDKDNQSIGKR